MYLPKIHGREKITEISKQLKFPSWWVESVIVEYFQCRRYAENGKLWTFDFNKLSDEDIKKIPEKKVIISEIVLMQNVRPQDLAQRTMLGAIGLPFTPLDEADLIPEGFANHTCFPSPIRNDISMSDYKLHFHAQAIVLDNSVFHQWSIAKSFHIKSEGRLWYKSELFDLSKLDSINRTLQKYQNSNEMKNPTPEFIKKIENEYDVLEIERKMIRAKILEYHFKNKPKITIKDVDIPTPPMLSCFETVKLTENGYQVKTHMEPLFLRSAIRNLHRAEEARETRDANPTNYAALLDEIEYSAMCIINSANCLEAYINFVINKHLPEYANVFKNASAKQKWVWVPHALDLSQKFKPSEQPLSNFSNLVMWRNNVIHHVAEYASVSGQISRSFSRFNLENAKIAVKTIKEMVTLLSSDEKIPLPRWIKTDMGGSDYWNEVRDYLKTI